MGKINAKMEGRTEGLELALRIVREGGAEALEREMKRRRVTGSRFLSIIEKWIKRHRRSKSRSWIPFLL